MTDLNLLVNTILYEHRVDILVECYITISFDLCHFIQIVIKTVKTVTVASGHVSATE